MAVQPPSDAPVSSRPPAKKPRPVPPRPERCLNCGAAAAGNFCADCGQENKNHTVALRPLLSDLLTELASWDSRLGRTVTALVARPGFLTNEYTAGRRVRYLSPLKMYLTVSVLFFLLLAWKNPLGSQIQMGISPAQSPQTILVFGGGPGEPLPHSEAEYDAYQKRLPAAKRDTPLEQSFVHHVIRAGQSKQEFVNALVGDIPKMMFFLLPAFAVALKLLYLRRKRLYVEHLVFLLHVHAFAFLLLMPLLLLHPDWLIVTIFLALPAYVLVAMRVVYRQGWPKTLLKFTLLGTGYFVLLSLCIGGTVLVALML